MEFQKNNKYELNLETADAALRNVLEACDRSSNTVSSSELILRQKQNTRLYNRMLILTTALLILTFLLPLGIVPVAKLLDRQGTPEPVALVNDYMEDGFLYLELSGDNILYEEAWMIGLDNETIEGIYDGQSGQICFPVPDSGEFNIYIPVKNDAPFHLLLTL